MMQQNIFALAVLVMGQLVQADSPTSTVSTTLVSTSMVAPIATPPGMGPDTNSSGSCWRYTESPSNGSDVFMGRSVAGRIMLDAFEDQRDVDERAPRLNTKAPITKLGTCTLNGPAGSYVSPEPYPGPRDLEAFAGAIYWYLPKQTNSPGGCPTMQLTSVANSAALAGSTIAPKATGYQIGGSKSDVNVDHVYEVSLMKDFWTKMLASTEISCTDLNAFFMASDSAHRGIPRLQSLWQLLPQANFPDFAGTENRLNGFKGNLWNNPVDVPNACKKGKNAIKSNDDRLKCMWDATVALEFMNTPAVAALFQESNNRIFAGMLGIDARVAALKAAGTAAPTPARAGSWASAYKSFMTSYVSNQNKQLTSIFNDFTAPGFFRTPLAASISSGSSVWSSKFARATMTMNTNALFGGANAFPTTSTYAINKRVAPTEAPAVTPAPQI